MKSRIIGLIYVLSIPVFALLYSVTSICMGEGFAGYDKANLDVWNGLYLSVVTLTTLGFGDISPYGVVGKVLVSIQSLSGILLIGLFLNSLSHERNNELIKLEKEKDLEAESKQQKRLRKVLGQHVLLMFDVFTSPGIFRWDMHAKNARPFNEMKDDIVSAMLLVRKGGGNKFGVVNVACLLSTSDQQYDTMVSLNSVAALVSNDCLETWTSWVSNVRNLKQKYEKAEESKQVNQFEDQADHWPTLEDLSLQIEELIINGLEILDETEVLM